MVTEYNKKNLMADIGTIEEFNSLKRTIHTQNKRIEQLNKEIDDQGKKCIYE
jgi:predicted  nucleic acid-binding Zn-ribbon protein